MNVSIDTFDNTIKICQCSATMTIKKAFLGFLIALILVPSVSVAANQSALETQRIELMKQVIVLLQARVEQLQVLLAEKYGIGPAVLGAATSTAAAETPKKRRSSGGGGGGSRNNDDAEIVVPPVTPPATTTATTTPEEPVEEGPTVEELQAQIAELIDTVNGILADDGKTLGDCEWVAEVNDGTAEAFQAQIEQLLSAISDLQNGEPTVNGCPLLDVVEAEPLVLSMQGTSTIFTVTANQTLDPEMIEITLVEFDDDIIPLELTLQAKVSDGSTFIVPLVKESGTYAYSVDMRARLADGKTFTGDFEVVFPDTITHGEIVYTAYYEGNGVTRTINLVKQRPPNPLGTELRFSLGSGNPDATDIVVDEDMVTSGVTVLEYTIEARDGDVVLNELWVRIETGFANVGAVVHDISLDIDGELFGAEAVATDTMTVDYLFDIDGDVTIGMGEAVVVKALVDFKAQPGNYVNGETIKASVPSVLADVTGAEGVDDIAPENISGSATGDTHTLVAAGILIPVDGVETTADASGDNDTTGEFTIEFEVTAVEGNYYITDNAAQGTSATDGVEYLVEGSAGTTMVSANLSSTADEDTNGVFTVHDGETETFTLTVVVDAAATGNFRVTLAGVNFSEDPDGTSSTELYTTEPAADFRTAYQNINVS